MSEYRIVLCESSLPGDQRLAEERFTKIGDAINFVQEENWYSFGLIFTIDEFTYKIEGQPKYISRRVCTYVHMANSEQINTMKDYEEMAQVSIYKDIVHIYDEFKDAMGIQEWV